MDRGAGWFETLNGPPPRVEPGAKPLPTIVQLGIQVHGWFDDRDHFENTQTVVSATFNEDPFHAAVETVWLATEPFVDKRRLLAELRELFLTNPGF